MVAISNVITSLCLYFQNLGAIVNSSNSFNLPSGIKKIFNALSRFLNLLANIVPQIPAFDIRAQLAIMAIGIPLILDIFFVWFVLPFKQLLSHIIDIGVIGFGTYYLVQSLIFQWTFGTKIIVSVCIGILFLRIIFNACCQHHGKETDFYKLADIICQHCLRGIYPKYTEKVHTKEIKRAIKKFSAVVEIVESEIKVIPMLSRFLIATIALLLSLWCLGVFVFEDAIPSGIRTVIPYIGFPLAFFLYLIFFMHLCECGRKAINAVKNFCKRWGLRLLMLFLDLLYIPILTYLIANILPKKHTCGEGNYLYYDHGATRTSLLFAFVNHTAVCKPCWTVLYNISETCLNLCSGNTEWRVMESLNLLFWRDEVQTFAGVLLYSVFAIMIGIPVLWSVIIYRNVTFLSRINVFGRSKDEKWVSLLLRLKTTGIFLFYNYGYFFSKWSIFIQIVKLVVVILTALATRFGEKISLALSFWYLLVVIHYIRKRPYISTFNNILDPLLYVCNLIVSLIPIYTSFGHSVSDKFIKPFSILIIIIPFVSLVFILCCNKRILTPQGDPTIPVKEEKEIDDEIIDRTMIIKEKSKKPKRKRRHRHHHHNDDDKNNDNNDRKKNRKHKHHHNKEYQENLEEEDGFELEYDDEEEEELMDDIDINAYQTTCKLIDEFDVIWDTQEEEDIEDCAVFQPIEIMSIKQFIEYERCKRRGNVTEADTEEIKINHERLIKTFNKMFDLLDTVIDGSTIYLLTSTLKWLIVIAAIAFGWYLGASSGFLESAEDVFCG